MATRPREVAPGAPLTLAEIQRLGRLTRSDIVRATTKWRRDARGLKRLLPMPAADSKPPNA